MTHAKDLLNKLCNDQNASSGIESISCILIPPAGASGYPPYQEIMVPGSKVGLVIGKGGETIKMLQEKTGAKMVIIQDGPGQELVVSAIQIDENGEHHYVSNGDFLIYPCRKSRCEYPAIH